MYPRIFYWNLHVRMVGCVEILSTTTLPTMIFAGIAMIDWLLPGMVDFEHQDGERSLDIVSRHTRLSLS